LGKDKSLGIPVERGRGEGSREKEGEKNYRTWGDVILSKKFHWKVHTGGVITIRK